jgi:hypothetical protein
MYDTGQVSQVTLPRAHTIVLFSAVLGSHPQWRLRSRPLSLQVSHFQAAALES